MGRRYFVSDMDREELKIAESLLCLLSTTAKTLMHPLLKTTCSFQIGNTQGLEYLSPTVAILLRVEMASDRC